jgi:hypothetical protein
MKLADGEYISGAGVYSKEGNYLREITLVDQLEAQLDGLRRASEKNAERIARGELVLKLIVEHPELATLATFFRTGVL